MPTCYRAENNLKCRYWCKRDWVFCHNYYDGYCRNDVVDYQCENGWHISQKRYRAKKLAELPADDSESQIRKRRIGRFEHEMPCDEETPKVKKCKRDPLLEIYLARLGYKPDEMPERREIENGFLSRTLMENSASELTYEEYSEAFQYIVDIIANGVPE